MGIPVFSAVPNPLFSNGEAIMMSGAMSIIRSMSGVNASPRSATLLSRSPSRTYSAVTYSASHTPLTISVHPSSSINEACTPEKSTMLFTGVRITVPSVCGGTAGRLSGTRTYRLSISPSCHGSRTSARVKFSIGVIRRYCA